MSRSVSSVTKTGSDISRTDVSEVQKPDRWSNHISYRQLVLSSCISILQFWWHPYVHDLRALLPFLFLYNAFSVLVAYPIFYLELALGVVTKKGVINSWDLAPIARGVGVSMLTVSIYTALALSAVCAYCLSMVVHSAHSFLPWLHCASRAPHACSARHRPLGPESDVPPMSYLANFVLKLKRNGLADGLGGIVWELAIYYAISWLLIYFIAFKRIYSYSKLVLFKDTLAFFTLICCAVGVSRLDGAATMFQVANWNVLIESISIWRKALEYALLEMTIAQGTLIMLGTYCPIQKHGLGSTAAVAFAVSKLATMLSALTLGAVHGALLKDYDGSVNNTNVWGGDSITSFPGAGMTIILWADLVARVPGSQFWSGVVFFTLFVLSLTTVALLVHTLMSTLTGKSVRKVSWAFLVLLCCLFCLIGILTLCSQGGLYVLNHLLVWPVARLRVPLAAALAVTVTHIYGQSSFCEDVYFAVGEYPCAFFRVSWAVCPVFLFLFFMQGMGVSPPPEGAVGWSLVVTSLLPIASFVTFYLVFKFRVRNIVNEQ